MARTVLFKRLRRLVREIDAARRLGLGDSQFRDLRGAGSPPTRRRFLQQSAAALAGTALVPSLRLPFPTLSRPSQEPVLILGAGAAGLAAAYTLKKLGVPFFMVEASKRVGGRIATQPKFNTDLQFIERGAELVDTNHETLIALAGELGLTIEDFAPGDAGLEPELFHFGGKLYTEHQFVEGIKPLVEKIAASSAEIYGESQEYITYKTVDVLPNAVQFDRLTLKEYLDSVAGDVPKWVRDAVEVAYLGEYGRETEEQSAINLIDLIDLDPSDGFTMFGESDESKRVQGGNSMLTQAIFEALKDNGKTPEDRFLRLEHALVSIKLAGDQLVCAFSGAGKTLEQKAAHVICTLPFTTLRDVEGLDTLSLSPVKLECIRKLGYGTNSKIMTSWRTRFWRKATAQVPAYTGSVYGDFPSQNLWETSRLQQGGRGILTAFLGGKRGLNAGSSSVEEVRQSLGRLYSDSVIKDQWEDVEVVMNWNKMPYSKGSYGCILAGQYTTLWGSAGEAELGGRLQFAGEHTSLDFQGYMNGAYETGVAAANAIVALRKS